MIDHVAVVGGSMAGLLAARAVAPHARHVTLIERDELRDDGTPRRGVPQGRHAHALLTAGELAFNRLLPGLTGELRQAGAHAVNLAANAIWHQAGARRVTYESSMDAITLTRPLLEKVVRRRVLDVDNVTLLQGAAREVIAGTDGQVRGIELEADGATSSLPADLVVDTTGRAAPLLGSLARLGHELPPVSQVEVDLAYGTVIVPRRPGDLDGVDYVYSVSETGRFGIVIPVEAERWIVTLSGLHGDHPPTDWAGYLAFARGMPTPQIAELLERAFDGGSIATHRLRSNQRRHVEKLANPPAGYVLLGDAICSFNPVYGQGMTSAAQQVEALAATLSRSEAPDRHAVKAFYRSAAKVVHNPWTIAAGADFNHPLTTGPKAFGTNTINRYMLHVLRACHTSPVIAEQMMRVQNLVDPPRSLLRPDRVVRVFAASHRSPARPSRSRPTSATSTTQERVRV